MDDRAQVVGIDVGGTFTDVIKFDPRDNSIRTEKIPTALDQSESFVAGLFGVLSGNSLDASIVHGTTVATNALLERKGAKCGLLTTAGFRDVLELGRRTRPRPYGMFGSFDPLIERDLRLEVRERISADGVVLVPLDEEDVRIKIQRLKELGAEALVIHFLHSYKNPVHEDRCFEIAKSIWPNGYISVGSHLISEMREYERGTTASVNAYVQPAISRYIGGIQKKLTAAAYREDLLVMQSNGGTMSAGIVSDNAVRTVLSGPAAGAIAAAEIGRQAGFPNLIAGDMGGTSFDVSLIANGEPIVGEDREMAYGMPLLVPMVDIHTIGAGGGSIAHITSAGLLQVGPESAGSYPGPIGFGRGGRRPTLVDANLLLGRLNSNALTGADNADLHAIEEAFLEQIGKPMGLSPFEAAEATIRIAISKMAASIRLVSIDRGYDPSEFVYFPFGGGGPLHAVSLAREIGIPKVVVPLYPGLTSALGCAIADVKHDFVSTVAAPLASLHEGEASKTFDDHIRQGRELVSQEGMNAAKLRYDCFADVSYGGQTHTHRISLEPRQSAPSVIARRFREEFAKRFKADLPGDDIILIALRTTVSVPRPKLDLSKIDARQPCEPGRATQTRQVWFDGRFVETPVMDRSSLGEANVFEGSLIVEQKDTTVVIDDRCVTSVDNCGNLIISLM